MWNFRLDLNIMLHLQSFTAYRRNPVMLCMQGGRVEQKKGPENRAFHES